MHTVAIYSYEDRLSAHRQKVRFLSRCRDKVSLFLFRLINLTDCMRCNFFLWGKKADEAYQVGAGLTPVAAYLAQEDIVRIALEHGVDMIHPGYVSQLHTRCHQPRNRAVVIHDCFCLSYLLGSQNVLSISIDMGFSVKMQTLHV